MSNPQTPDNTGTPGTGLALPLDSNDPASSGFAAAAQAALGNVASSAAVTSTGAAAGAAPANTNTAAQGAGAQPPGGALPQQTGGGNTGGGGTQGGNRPNSNSNRNQQRQQPGGGGGNQPQNRNQQRQQPGGGGGNQPQNRNQQNAPDSSWDMIDRADFSDFNYSLREHIKAILARPDGIAIMEELAKTVEDLRVNVGNMQLALGQNVTSQIAVERQLKAMVDKLTEVLAAHNPAKTDEVLKNINERLGKLPTADNFRDLVDSLTKAVEKGFKDMSATKHEPAHGAGGHDAGHGGAHAHAEAKTDKKKEEKLGFWHLVGAVILALFLFALVAALAGLVWDGAANRFGNFIRGNTGVSSPTPFFVPVTVPAPAPAVPSVPASPPPAPLTIEERVQKCAAGFGGGAEAEADCRKTITGK